VCVYNGTLFDFFRGCFIQCDPNLTRTKGGGGHISVVEQVPPDHYSLVCRLRKSRSAKDIINFHPYDSETTAKTKSEGLSIAENLIINYFHFLLYHFWTLCGQIWIYELDICIIFTFFFLCRHFLACIIQSVWQANAKWFFIVFFYGKFAIQFFSVSSRRQYIHLCFYFFARLIIFANKHNV
jgi:hypothetical protein